MKLISLDIHVDRLNDVLSIFDQIEVRRSTAGINGPFTEISDAAGSTAARIDGTGTGTFTLSGLILEVEIDGGPLLQATFTGTDPLDLATVLAQIEAQIPGLAVEVPTDTDKVRITSPTTGTGSALLVTDNAAATELGLSIVKVNGKGDRVPLISPTTDYVFRDLDGAAVYYYQTRYSSTTTPLTSDYSTPRQGEVGVVISASLLSKAKISMVTGTGNPVVDRFIRFVPLNVNAIEGEYQIIPGFDARVIAKTNEQGLAEISLLRGVTYRVFFEGSGYAREFVVPDQPEFDLLQLIGLSPDPFDIVQAPARPIKVS